MKQEDIQKQFISALQSENIKLTPQRQAIFSNIMASEGHRECEDIYNSLEKSGVSISRATVYRTLDILEKYNLVRKLVIGDGRAKYEKNITII